jgi:hypothetical protein
MSKNRGKSKLSKTVLFNANKHVFHCEKSLGILVYGQPSYIHYSFRTSVISSRSVPEILLSIWACPKINFGCSRAVSKPQIQTKICSNIIAMFLRYIHDEFLYLGALILLCFFVSGWSCFPLHALATFRTHGSARKAVCLCGCTW